ncbi:MAG TPA: hypothetical protein VJO99_06810 [Burkholderiaceae bacterium]|nr:hypothetical protein [Burkholderiaceae bacterium]
MKTLASLVLSSLALAVLASACGGGNGVFDGERGAAGARGANALVALSAEAPGAHCSLGGLRVDAGRDLDGNGTLAATEVGSTQYACNGSTGASGLGGAAGSAGRNGVGTLVQLLDEPPGANCTAGGKAVRVGSDANADGVLDAGEISSTGYLCDGTGGATGSDGSNGANGSDGNDGVDGSNGASGSTLLVSTAAEPAGANCPNGGRVVSAGLDSNADGVLGAGEVTSTRYLCDGAPAPLMSWVSVTGPSVQAQSNTAYLASNDAQPVTVTLPASPAVGDIVHLSGAGLGGWTIAQNAGQTIYTTNLGDMAGANWTPQGPSGTWTAIASSADGRKLVATISNGQIYTSTDGGISWTARDSNRIWYAVASSADGSKLVAVARSGGQIHTSSDSGVTWTPRDANRDWQSVASSADGSKLLAADRGGRLYTSVDSGLTWTPREAVRNWRAVASSADGTKLVAAVASGQLYTSTDSGATWTPRDANRNWYAIASSADGSTLLAAEYHGQLYTSSDSGATWSARDSLRDWLAVASSADGSRLVATVSSGLIYTSADSGLSWTPHASAQVWGAVASSADGSRLAAARVFAQVYTSVASTTLGTAGSISGARLDSIELQYVGGGTFNVLSHEGKLTIQ